MILMKNFSLIILIALISLLSIQNTIGQVSDDFSDGDFTSNPTWEGDVDRFIVNGNGELQLNDVDAGSSQLFVPTSFVEDNTWEFMVRLEFAPSQSNAVTVYLMVDDYTNPTQYLSLEYGENGSDDALIIYEFIDDSKTEIARGTAAAVGEDPAQVQVVIDRIDGEYSVKTDYSVSGVLTEEFTFESSVNIDQGYFGVSCLYTSSRSDKFFFDNIRIDEYVPDTEGPEIVSYENLSPSSFVFYFNEIIDENSITQADVSINPIIDIQQISSSGNPSNAIIIDLEEDLESGPLYTITIDGITDVLGNEMMMQSFDFQLQVSPEKGDVLINEVLFDPYSGQNDFIELYNHSDKVINLQDCTIENVEKETFELIATEIILMPGEYIAFTADADQVGSTYEVPDSARIQNQDIPSLNISSGNVSLFNPSMEVIDSMSYTEDWHYDLLYETKGVSIERIRFDGPSNESSNWFSASSSVNFASPGYQNSNALEMVESAGDLFEIPENSFSPNGDGDRDFVQIFVNTDETGWVGTITVFDTNGAEVKKIANNKLLSHNDQLIWDGLDENSQRCNIGHYIVLLSAFNNQGETISQKAIVNLLDYIR